MFNASPSLDIILNRPQPSFWASLLESPYKTLATKLYSYRSALLKTRLEDATRLQKSTIHKRITVVSVADTHNKPPKIPDGDLFIHAGDLTQGGSVPELQSALDWIHRLPHQHKIVVAGNHDMCLDSKFGKYVESMKSLEWKSITYLQDDGVNLLFQGGRKLAVYGTPHTRKHGSWAFEFARGTDVFSNTVPDDTDIVVSHSPPRFHLDVDGWGDEYLLSEIRRVKPRLHVFGHIHAGYGTDVLLWDDFQDCYEGICRGTLGLWFLLKMVGFLGLASWRGQGEIETCTLAVNPAITGGLRDTIQRQPIVCHL